MDFSSTILRHLWVYFLKSFFLNHKDKLLLWTLSNYNIYFIIVSRTRSKCSPKQNVTKCLFRSFLSGGIEKTIYTYTSIIHKYIFALKFRLSFLKTWIIHVYVSQLQKTKKCSFWQFSWTWIQVFIFWVWNDGNFFFFLQNQWKNQLVLISPLRNMEHFWSWLILYQNI